MLIIDICRYDKFDARETLCRADERKVLENILATTKTRINISPEIYSKEFYARAKKRN